MGIYSREFKQRRFWARHVNRKWAFSLLICLDATKFILLKCFYSYKHDLLKKLFKVTAQECKRSTFGSSASLQKTLIQNFFGAFGPYWSVWLVLPSSLTFLNLKDVRRKGTPSWEAETDILKTHPTIRLRHTSALYRSIQILRPISWVRWAQIKLLFKSIAEETAKSTMSSSCCECLSKPAAEVMLDGEEFTQEYTN